MAQDFAQCMRDLVDIHYPQAERIPLLLDNLSTHTAAALYQSMPPQEARPILPRIEFCPCPWNPYPIAESRIGLLGLSRMPVFLEPHRADVRQRGVQPGAVVPEYPGDDLVLGLAPRHEALPMQSLHLQRTEQGLAAGVVPAIALAAHRGRDAALGEHVPEVLAGVLAAPVAVEDQPDMLARMALEPGHAHSIDDDVARHVLAQ